MDRLFIVITIVKVGEEDRVVVVSIVSDVSAFGSWLNLIANSGSGLSRCGASSCSEHEIVCVSTFCSDASSGKRTLLVSIKEITQVTTCFTLADNSRNPDCSVVDGHWKNKEPRYRISFCKV